MDLDQGYWIRVFEKILYLKEKGWIRLFKGKSGSACYGAKMAPCLWRADPSFRNSVTGSGSRAKCSNILQDKHLFQGQICTRPLGRAHPRPAYRYTLTFIEPSTQVLGY